MTTLKATLYFYNTFSAALFFTLLHMKL